MHSLIYPHTFVEFFPSENKEISKNRLSTKVINSILLSPMYSKNFKLVEHGGSSL
jgi:hypothetical protein